MEYDFRKTINLQIEFEETPIRDYMKSIITIFNSMKRIKECIEKMMNYFPDHARYCIDSHEDYNVIKQECGKIISDSLFEIKTFWNIFGTLMVPIRNYSSRVGTIYSVLKDEVDINMLESIFKTAEKYPKDFELIPEYDPDRKFLSAQYGDLANGLSRILISAEKLSALESISSRRINDVNWAFMTFLISSLEKIATDPGIEAEIINEVDGKCYPDFIISECIEKIRIMYSYIAEKLPNLVHEARLHDFICALINVLLYKTYEDLQKKFGECFNEYCENIKRKYGNAAKTITEEKLIEG